MSLSQFKYIDPDLKGTRSLTLGTLSNGPVWFYATCGFSDGLQPNCPQSTQAWSPGTVFSKSPS